MATQSGSGHAGTTAASGAIGIAGWSVALGLSISDAPDWVAWVFYAIALIASLYALYNWRWFRRHFPLQWVGFSGERDAQFMQFVGARMSLQQMLEALESFKKDDRLNVQNLRVWSTLWREQLQKDGFPRLASLFEVVLNDDAPIESVKDRANYFNLLIRSTLIYDKRLLSEMDLM